MSELEGGPTLTMREMAASSGVSEGTLRMWEARHEFPVPSRLPSGHRRYSPLDLRRVLAVVDAREQGLSLRTAIERARQIGEEATPSVFAALREEFPRLTAHTMPKRALINLSFAIEDELIVRGERPLLFGCFQHERFYRAVEPRWRELARTAQRAIVLADFPRKRKPAGAPAEVPIRQSDPLMREWVLVCDAPRFAACLAAVERPSLDGRGRQFETVWTFEGAVVRAASRVCCELIARTAPELVEDVRGRLDDPLPSVRDELRLAVDLT